MAERGFQSTTESDGSTRFATDGLPDEKAADQNYAIYVCSMQYVPNPYITLPLPKAAASQLYDYWVTEVTPCLRGRGVVIPDPPAKDSWLDTYLATEMFPWNPYDEANDPAAMNAHKAACPPYPVGFFPEV